MAIMCLTNYQKILDFITKFLKILKHNVYFRIFIIYIMPICCKLDDQNNMHVFKN